MFCDRTDRSDADSLSQTGTDKAEVTFCPIPRMPVCVVIFYGVCFVCVRVCAILHYVLVCFAVWYLEPQICSLYAFENVRGNLMY